MSEELLRKSTGDTQKSSAGFVIPPPFEINLRDTDNNQIHIVPESSVCRFFAAPSDGVADGFGTGAEIDAQERGMHRSTERRPAGLHRKVNEAPRLSLQPHSAPLSVLGFSVAGGRRAEKGKRGRSCG